MIKRFLLSDGLFLRLITIYRREVLSQMEQDQDDESFFRVLAKA